MTVQTYIPGDVRISMTPAAIRQARRELERAGARGLRLSVKPSGCSGYMYILDYVHEEAADDRAFDVEQGVTLYVDGHSTHILNGTEIDYVTEGVNSFFKFRNPNATGECGCGESFTVNG